MRIAYFDAFSGVSGDMTVGSLIDAGADTAALFAGLDSLGTQARFSAEKVKRKGIAATKFDVAYEDPKKHRHLPHIVKMIEAAALPDTVKRNAIRIFEALGAAEAASHGVPIEKVHFHEVGAVDSICDIAGACLALHLVGAEAVYCSAINTGSGTVDTSHGVMPVPAPATARLLEGKPVYARGPAVELTTPTGAAILSTLAAGFGALPPVTLERSGYGAGGKEFSEHANVLRVLLGSTSGAPEAATVIVIEANIDDSTPEVLGYAMDRLLQEGALDVTLQPLIMKKQRPGVLLRILARPEDRDKLSASLFRQTSTFGLRYFAAERTVETRRHVTVQTDLGPVRIKIAGSGAWAPEYDDCRALADQHGVPLKDVLARAGQAYWKEHA